MIKKVNIFYGWWVVGACFLLSLYVGSSVFWGFTAFFEPLVAEFGWSYAQVSFATSLRGLEMGIMAPLVGFLVDRYGARKLILAGVVSIGIGLITLSRTGSLVTFYASFLLLAFGAGGCTAVVTMSVLAHWFRRRLGLALGIMASGFGASGLFIPLIVRLVDTQGWRPTLVILGVGMWIIGLPLAFIIRDRPEEMGLRPDGPPPEKDGSAGLLEEESGPPFNFRQAYGSGAFMALLGAEFVRMVAVQSVGLHIMPYLSHLGFTRSMGGLIAAGLPLFSVAGRMGFGYLGDILDKRKVMSAAFGLMTLGMAVLYLLQGPWLALLFLLLFSPGFGGGMVLRGSILRECFGQAYFGRLIGLVMAAAALGGLIGPFLTGWFFDLFHQYKPLWLVYCVLIGLAASLIRFIRPLSPEQIELKKPSSRTAEP